jgi:Holliday junction resolvase
MIASELEKDGFMVIRINSSTQIAESGTRLSSYRVTNINATAGHADLVVYRNGKAWMLEVKRDKRGKKSESQERFASCCRRYGVPYSIVTCADDARNFISQTMDQYP